MRTKLYPMVQFKKDTWEIDEFDCASMFLLVGSEKAMLIDCGIGIGDLRGAVEMITDKPLIVVATHGHIDHTGNGRQFEEIWMNPADQPAPIPQSLAKRRHDVAAIAQRQKGCIGNPYAMFRLYPYDIDIDLHEPDPSEREPVLRDLVDGQQFDLGGGRIVTAYDCPGHTRGEMVFLDSMTRSLFAGDAINFNLGLGATSVETSLRYLKRIAAMSDQYDGIYNGHHDFRPLGAPLEEDCLPNIIALCEDVLRGNLCPVQLPNPWGQVMPLGKRTNQPEMPALDPVSAELFSRGKHPISLQRGRNFVSIDPEKIFDRDC